MARKENAYTLSYHSRHDALSAMYALAEEPDITDPEIIINTSGSDKKPKMLVFSRDEGTLPDQKGWQRYEKDNKLEAVTMVASTDPDDKRRFTVMYLPDMGDMLVINFVAGIGKDEEDVLDFLLSV